LVFFAFLPVAERANPATVFSKSLSARVSDACALANVVFFMAAMISSEVWGERVCAGDFIGAARD
jgi:hypothetical protein